MRIRIAQADQDAEKLIPPASPDNSRIGINYADAYIKAMNVDLDDGRKVACKRKGLKITLSIGDRVGEALMRRIEHGPDVRSILDHALQTAAAQAGARFLVEDGVIYLDM